MIEKALRRAFSLGQTYWQQADSESYSQNKKSEDTYLKFQSLVAETIEQQPDSKPSAHGLEGWKEATIAWAVCASLHREYCTGKDPFFTTRQADFVRHENDARAMLNQFSQENKSQEG